MEENLAFSFEFPDDKKWKRNLYIHRLLSLFACRSYVGETKEENLKGGKIE